jgi:hypothetical protein
MTIRKVHDFLPFQTDESVTFAMRLLIEIFSISDIDIYYETSTGSQALRLTGLAGSALTLGVLPGLGDQGGHGSSALRRSKLVKLSPLPGVSYRKRTLDFMERARFETPRQAIYGMKDPRIPFVIESVPADPSFPQRWRPPIKAGRPAV